ncbi:hypothetical protein [Halobaculum magnesiiphilum]|uniref:Uncharacterized protein n=1 Tax=Halobaculum magnesiiphilum TaxID=1017351 RepID=A0A8T8WG43_9EURY|nr:hypothetical protein [Halobaculum magnesiiphilum]QZP38827.1 hypothetical protein K6T50_06730 [Halobaculum magnesiiphilum]
MAVSTSDVSSRSYTGLEGILLGFPVLGAVAGLAMLVAQAAGVGSATGLVAGMGAMWVFGLLVALAIPVLLYLDATELGDHDLDWSPSPVLYAVLGFLFSGLVLIHYLYRRHEEVRSTGGGSDRWWLVAVGAVVLPAILSALSFGGLVPSSVFAGLALAFLLPVGVYKDAVYVRGGDAGWNPNPAMQFTVAFVSLLLPILSVPYLGYYLYKRYTSVGLP